MKVNFSTWTNYVTVKQFNVTVAPLSYFSTWTNYVTVKPATLDALSGYILVPEQITWL